MRHQLLAGGMGAERERRDSQPPFSFYGENMICKKCKKEISEARPNHFSNQLAKKLGYCSFICLSADVGSHKALEILQKEEHIK